MNADRLYIDNSLVDTPASGLNITLNFKGNVLDALKGISSNYTNTVRLPRTEHNLSIFDEAQVVSNKTRYPYTYHSAQYESDGVALIRNGRAVLMNIGKDSIDITIIWGAGAAFDLLSSDHKLSDLTASGSDAIAINKAITTWGSSTNAPTCFHDSNLANNPESLLLPVGTATFSPCFRSIKASYILTLISSQLGGAYDFQGLAAAENAYVLASGAVMTGNGGALSLSLPDTAISEEKMLVRENRNTTANTTIYKKSQVWDNLWLQEQAQIIRYFGGQNGNGFTAMCDVYASIYVGLLFNTTTQTSDITLQVVDDSDNVIGGYSAPTTTVGSYRQMSVGGSLQLQAGKKYFIRLVGAADFAISPQSYVEIGMTNNSSPAVGLYYSPIRSLPAVKIVDFIATLAAISGTFPVAAGDEGVKFYTYESLFASDPIDWSYKVAGYSVAYKASGWAQSNRLQWAEGQHSGNVHVSDETIEQNRDWFKSQFNIGENSFYPYFERKSLSLIDQNGESFDGQIWEYKQPKPCIHYIKEAIDTFAGISLVAVDFNSMDFANVVNTRYRAFSAIMTSPRIVDVDVRMNAAEIIALDLSATYYFEQLGGKFAIISMQYAKGVAKCKMLRIPVEY